MRRVQEVAGHELEWARAALLRPEYELRASEDDVVATLRWPSSLRSLAEAEAADGSWTFKRAGFLLPRATIRVAGSDEDLGTFRPGWSGNGLLTLEGGGPQHWAASNFARTRFAWEDEGGDPLVSFRVKTLRGGAHVEVAPAARGLESLSLLLLLGWYLAVSEQNDTSGASAPASGSYGS